MICYSIYAVRNVVEHIYAIILYGKTAYMPDVINVYGIYAILHM
jgi:hypothetical protein